MTENMRDALKGSGGGLQSISNVVGDAMGGGMDLRGGQSKKSDEAGKGIKDMGKSKGQTVPSSSVDAKNQVENQHTGSADHLELGMRKET
ncbi:hypothetical protein Q7P37_003369 [Cladosporium fusiforme]